MTTGEFKKVTSSIRKLTSEDCEKYAREGSLMVDGHELVAGDLRLIFEFAGSDDKSVLARLLTGLLTSSDTSFETVDLCIALRDVEKKDIKFTK